MLLRRRFGLPFAFLWALAHGLWVGATWHAGIEGVSFESQGPAVVLHRCVHAACSTPVNRTAIEPASTAPAGCALCELGLVLPDAPSAPVPLPALAEDAIQSRPSPLVSVLQVHTPALPPGRGPPAA